MAKEDMITVCGGIKMADLMKEPRAAKTKITLSITQEDSDTVKMYALRNHTTVSNLLHEWIAEKCGE